MFYSEDLVEEIRTRNDIVDVISGYVRLQKKGNSYFGLCPFHNEKSPSFSVTPSKQMYYCFGCGTGGNVFTFMMEYENNTFPETLRILGERAGMSLPEEEEYSKEAKKRADTKSLLLDVQKEAATYFYRILRSERGLIGQEYLKKRRLTEETMKRFGLGFSGKTGSELYSYLRKKGFHDDILKDSGLVFIEERKSRDRFWNRVMFPIMDTNNRVIGFGGRVLGDGEPKYLNSPETKIFDKSRNLYGLNYARSSRRSHFILCEGYMDVIALHQAGFTNAVASLGTSFTSGQASLMKRYTNEVYLTYDSDTAGIKAALRAIPICKEAGISAKIIDMKPYKDPDEFIKNMGVEVFEERMKHAVNSFMFEVSVQKQQYDMNDPEEKTKFHTDIAQLLLGFPEELERTNYMEAVAREYHISYESLKQLVHTLAYQRVRQVAKVEVSKPNQKDKKHEKKDGIRHSQKILLTWLIEELPLFDKLKGIITPRDFTEELYQVVAELLFAQYEQEKKVTPARIISHFTTEEEQKEAAALFNTSLQEDLTQKEREKALNETVKKIKMYWCEYAGSKATSIEDLTEISKVKRSLQDLHISLG